MPGPGCQAHPWTAAKLGFTWAGPWKSQGGAGQGYSMVGGRGAGGEPGVAQEALEEVDPHRYGSTRPLTLWGPRVLES